MIVEFTIYQSDYYSEDWAMVAILGLRAGLMTWHIIIAKLQRLPL